MEKKRLSVLKNGSKKERNYKSKMRLTAPKFESQSKRDRLVIKKRITVEESAKSKIKKKEIFNNKMAKA